MELLRGENLTQKFDYLLFEDLNFSVKEQDSVAIVGVSGCGKSTLLHILCTLLKPDNGKVFYNNHSIYDLNEKELLQIRRDEFGIIFQSHYLFKGFTALENIELASKLSNKPFDSSILEMLQIQDVIKNRVTNLSGGQQQRVSIARVLAKKPKIIFADEPTGNLDSKTANDVIDSLLKYNNEQNGAFIMVTHDKELAFKCKRVFNLENNQLKLVKKAFNNTL